MRIFSKISGILLVPASFASASITGPYIGVSAGYHETHGKFDTYNRLNGLDILIKKKSLGSFLGGLNAGWGFRSNCLYAGVEVEALYNSLDKRFIHSPNPTTGNESFKVEQKFQYGAALRFGYSTASNVLFYARMGLSNGSWRIHYKASLNGTSYSRSRSFTQATLVPGIGVEGMVCKKVSVRAELRHATPINNRFYIGDVPAPIAGKFEQTKTLSRFRQTSFLVSALYHI